MRTIQSTPIVIWCSLLPDHYLLVPQNTPGSAYGL